MINKTIKTIHCLRIYVLVITVIAFFYYLGANPIQIGKYIGARFGGAVGMSTSVPENPFNKLAADLKDKEERLNQRENDLNTREAALADVNSGDIALLVMGGGIIVLFVLVTVNYFLDYRRKKAKN